MAVLIGHASSSETGGINGQKGDQTGGEVCTRSWYSRPWNYVIRFTDKSVANDIAEAMESACSNNKIGYGQSDRYDVWDLSSNFGFNPAKILYPSNCDCSSLVGVCIQYAIYNKFKKVVNPLKWVTTFDMLTVLLSNVRPLFDYIVYAKEEYTKSSDKLVRGDILLNTNAHVAIVTQGNSSAPEQTNPGFIYCTGEAYEYNRSLTGTYSVDIKNIAGNFLNVRDQATANSPILTTLSRGETVHNFGYYTSNKEGKWMYCMIYKGQNIYVGFIASQFLKKQGV